MQPCACVNALLSHTSFWKYSCTGIDILLFCCYHSHPSLSLSSLSSLSWTILISALSPCRDTHTHTEGWSLLYLLYWHLWPCIFILLTSVYYIKWAFTSIILNIIDQEIMDNVWHQSSHQATFLAINIAFQYVGIKWSRPKIGPIKFWSWSQVSLQ